MTGRGDPPEGTPEEFPGGDDEYRSIVFDESFVRAARIQEFSASERMRADARAVRTRRIRGPVPRPALVLMAVVVLAFGIAVYLGLRHPYQEPEPAPTTELAISLIPLAPPPDKPRKTGDPKRLIEESPAAHYRIGAQGLTLPPARRTEHFTEKQVLQALTAAKEFLVASAVDPNVLLGKETRRVRRLLDPGQFGQFDRSLDRPADDGRHSATGWMVRFDPARIALADRQVRIAGSMEVRETESHRLQVRTDHTFVYAVQSATARGDSARPVLFTVRRELRMQFDEAALRKAYLTLVESAAEAGPQRGSDDASEFFQPVLVEEDDTGGRGTEKPDQGGTDPFDRDRPVTAACGVLAKGF